MKLLVALLMMVTPLFAADVEEHYACMIEIAQKTLAWAPECRVCYPLSEPIVRKLGGIENIKLRLAQEGFNLYLSHVDRVESKDPLYNFMIGKLKVPEADNSNATNPQALPLTVPPPKQENHA